MELPISVEEGREELPVRDWLLCLDYFVFVIRLKQLEALHLLYDIASIEKALYASQFNHLNLLRKHIIHDLARFIGLVFIENYRLDGSFTDADLSSFNMKTQTPRLLRRQAGLLSEIRSHCSHFSSCVEKSL